MASKKQRKRSKASPERAVLAQGATPVDTRPGSLLSAAVELLASAGPKAALAAVLVHLPLVWLIFEGLPPNGLAFYELVSLVGVGASLHIGIRHAEGDRAVSVAGALRVGVRCWFGLFAAALFGGLMVLVLLLLLVVPGILRWLSYAIAFPIIVAGEQDGVAALALSATRMKGRRHHVAFALLVASLPVLLVVMVAGALDGTLAAWVAETPLVALTVVDPAPADAQLAQALKAIIYPIAELPMTMVSVVLYMRTRGAQRSG